MKCRNCGRELAEVPALGSNRGETVVAHVDTNFTLCGSPAEVARIFRGGVYRTAARAEPVDE